MLLNELWKDRFLESGLPVWKAEEVERFRKRQLFELRNFICRSGARKQYNRDRRWLLKNSPAFTIFKILIHACEAYFELSPRHGDLELYLDNLASPEHKAPRQLDIGGATVSLPPDRRAMEPVAEALIDATERALSLTDWRSEQNESDLDRLCYQLLLISSYAQEEELTRTRRAAADSRAGKGGALAAKYFARQYAINNYKRTRGRNQRNQLAKEIQQELLKNEDPKSWAAEGERARRTIKEWIAPQLTEINLAHGLGEPVLLADEKPLRSPMVERKMPWYD
ncbi:hypothetical protein D9M68_329920 [compost metagenome]